MPRRQAFTLIELLVVIAIIATLAGLLIPTVSMVQGKMKDVKCSNQLRQVATAIIAWQGDHDERTPPKLLRMFEPNSGMRLNGLQGKLLVCPKDKNKGLDSAMGRDGAAIAPLFPNLYEQGSSYFYQCSDNVLVGKPLTWFFDFPDTHDGEPKAGCGYLGKRSSAVTSPTWFDGKRNQLEFGNSSADYNPDPTKQTGTRFGYPFPADLFPIIMCFHHNRWSTSNNKTDRKCVCVSWNGNVFWTIPKWEHAINANIPP